MKLYYKPGACSLASHIMLHEVGADFTLVAVDTDAGKTEGGRDYRTINPNGYVPALETDGGDVLTEGAAILQFIADTHAAQSFSPAQGSIERARLQQFLNYAAAELHKAWAPLFSVGSTDVQQQAARATVMQAFDYLETVFSDGRAYLVGHQFSVADAYMFVLVYWSHFKGIDLAPWPHLSDFVVRISERPSAKAAFAAEGLA